MAKKYHNYYCLNFKQLGLIISPYLDSFNLKIYFIFLIFNQTLSNKIKLHIKLKVFIIPHIL